MRAQRPGPGTELPACLDNQCDLRTEGRGQGSSALSPSTRLDTDLLNPDPDIYYASAYGVVHACDCVREARGKYTLTSLLPNH
jgi:hypothetical protein